MSRASRSAGCGRPAARGAFAAAVAIAAVLAAASSAFALSVNAGLSLPTGELGNRAGLGYNLGATVTFPIAPLIAWGVQGTYHRLPVDDSWSPAGAPGDLQGSWKVLEGLLIVRAKLPTGPFGLAGVGLARTWDDLEGFNADDSTDMAYVVGGGFKVTLLELRALWHGRSGNGGSIVSVAAGLGF